MRRILLSFVLLLLSLSQSFAYQQQSINITVNGQQRNMVVFTPDVLPAKSPLFIVTHGMNQDPEYQYGSEDNLLRLSCYQIIFFWPFLALLRSFFLFLP